MPERISIPKDATATLGATWYPVGDDPENADHVIYQKDDHQIQPDDVEIVLDLDALFQRKA